MAFNNELTTPVLTQLLRDHLRTQLKKALQPEVDRVLTETVDAAMRQFKTHLERVVFPDTFANEIRILLQYEGADGGKSTQTY